MKRRSFLKSMLGVAALPLTPFSEISPQRLDKIETNRFDILERSSLTWRQAIQREEDMRIFNAINRLI